MRGPDGSKPMAQVCFQRRRVVGTDERKYLLVPFSNGRAKRRPEQLRGNALTPVIEVDVRSKHADVIERMGVTGERLHALEAHYLIVGWPDRHDEDTTRGKVPDVLALGIRRERCVEG